MAIDAIEKMKLDFSVPSVFLPQIQIGDAISTEARGLSLPAARGLVSAIDSRVDPATRSISVRATVPNGDGRLRPGLLMSVLLNLRPRTALVVPEEAVLSRGESRSVFVVGGDGMIARRVVQTGRRGGGSIEIASGLSRDERVVVYGHQRLSEGGTVSIIATKTKDETITELLQRLGSRADQ